MVGVTDYIVFVGPELVASDVPMIHVQALKDVPLVLMSIFGGTAMSVRKSVALEPESTLRDGLLDEPDWPMPHGER